MSDLKRLLQIPPYATIADICRTVNHVIKKLIPGYSNAAVDTDWNNLTTPGLFLNSASASNSPSLTATEYYCLTLAYANSSDVAQIAIPYDVADGLYIRNYYAGSWSIWTGSGGGSGTVTDFNFTNANGFTGVVTNSTTIPNLTLDGNNLLSLMGDVDISSPANNDVLTYVTADSKWENKPSSGGTGTVTTVSVASANGFAGTVANPTTTPAITLETSVNGLLLGNGTSVSSGPMTTKGDIIIENATPYPDRLPIGTTGQLLTVVGGLPAWAANSGLGNVQTFGAGTSVWTKPANVSVVVMLAIGPGGNGGNGYATPVYTTHASGGGGGGSGGQSIATFMAAFLPATLSVFVSAGGSVGQSTVSLGTSPPIADIFVSANGGLNGQNGVTGTPGAGGAAAGSTPAANQALSKLCFLQVSGTQNVFVAGGTVGIPGGGPNGGGSSITTAFTGILTLAGTGGGGLSTTTNAVGYPGGSQNPIGATLITTLAGGTAGATGGGNGGDGNSGSNYPYPGLFLPRGGTGGGSGGMTVGGTSGYSGNGGAGAIGCGGGGGAAGVLQAGSGGAGGDGVVIIISW